MLELAAGLSSEALDAIAELERRVIEADERAALRQACEQLRAEGAPRIGVEVDVEDDQALGLYASVGFTPVITEDYFALPVN